MAAGPRAGRQGTWASMGQAPEDSGTLGLAGEDRQPGAACRDTTPGSRAQNPQLGSSMSGWESPGRLVKD